MGRWVRGVERERGVGSYTIQTVLRMYKYSVVVVCLRSAGGGVCRGQGTPEETSTRCVSCPSLVCVFVCVRVACGVQFRLVSYRARVHFVFVFFASCRAKMRRGRGGWGAGVRRRGGGGSCEGWKEDEARESRSRFPHLTMPWTTYGTTTPC